MLIHENVVTDFAVDDEKRRAIQIIKDLPFQIIAPKPSNSEVPISRIKARSNGLFCYADPWYQYEAQDCYGWRSIRFTFHGLESFALQDRERDMDLPFLLGVERRSGHVCVVVSFKGTEFHIHF